MIFCNIGSFINCTSAFLQPASPSLKKMSNYNPKFLVGPPKLIHSPSHLPLVVSQSPISSSITQWWFLCFLWKGPTGVPYFVLALRNKYMVSWAPMSFRLFQNRPNGDQKEHFRMIFSPKLLTHRPNSAI